MPIPTPEATRKLLLEAVHNSNYESAIAHGRQLADENSAAPGDLSIVAQSYSSVGDCENARLWAQKAQDAFQAAGVVPEVSLRRAISCCGAGPKNYELAIVSIERGLRKGGIVHLDEAYVYLGLSKQAIGDIEGARNAFSKLKDVPGTSHYPVRLQADPGYRIRRSNWATSKPLSRKNLRLSSRALNPSSNAAIVPLTGLSR